MDSRKINLEKGSSLHSMAESSVTECQVLTEYESIALIHSYKQNA